MRDILSKTGAVAAAAILLSGLVFATACRRESGRPVIAVTLLTQTHPFYRDLEEGMREEAAERQLDLRVQSSEFNPATQATQIEDFVAGRVQAIVVCPSDSATVGRTLAVAERAGIPVFTADIAAHSGSVVSHIASDNVRGGRLAAQALAGFMGGEGEMIIIDHPVVASAQDRVKGFEEEIRKHPQIRIVAKPVADGQRAKALAVMEDMLQAHRRLKGVFGVNDDSALGALSAVEKSGREGVVIVGYDANPDARAAIARGSALKADVVQDPREMGRKTIETVARHLAGEPVPPFIPIEVGLVDRDALLGK
jgi:ribose transport system substrate-binding protein